MMSQDGHCEKAAKCLTEPVSGSFRYCCDCISPLCIITDRVIDSSELQQIKDTSQIPVALCRSHMSVYWSFIDLFFSPKYNILENDTVFIFLCFECVSLYVEHFRPPCIIMAVCAAAYPLIVACVVYPAVELAAVCEIHRK